MLHRLKPGRFPHPSVGLVLRIPFGRSAAVQSVVNKCTHSGKHFFASLSRQMPIGSPPELRRALPQYSSQVHSIGLLLAASHATIRSIYAIVAGPKTYTMCRNSRRRSPLDFDCPSVVAAGEKSSSGLRCRICRIASMSGMPLRPRRELNCESGLCRIACHPCRSLQ